MQFYRWYLNGKTFKCTGWGSQTDSNFDWQKQLFYATAMKTFNSNFGNPMVVLLLKLKWVLDLPQITNENVLRAGLRAFYQQLKSAITRLNSMGDTSAINSIENTMKAITILTRYLRSKFYRDFKDAKLNNQSLNLTTFKICLEIKLLNSLIPYLQ